MLGRDEAAPGTECQPDRDDRDGRDARSHGSRTDGPCSDAWVDRFLHKWYPRVRCWDERTTASERRSRALVGLLYERYTNAWMSNVRTKRARPPEGRAATG